MGGGERRWPSSWTEEFDKSDDCSFTTRGDPAVERSECHTNANALSTVVLALEDEFLAEQLINKPMDEAGAAPLVDGCRPSESELSAHAGL